MNFLAEDFETLEECPWCNKKGYTVWCKDIDPFITVRCNWCEIIYVCRRLNKTGRYKFYENYYADIHQVQNISDRKNMYHLERDFIQKYINGGKVLDVGCSDGQFMAEFSNKWEKYGVEIGEQAVLAAEQYFGNNIYVGDLVELEKNINKKFDLIIFRGVIEHVPFPKQYLETSIRLLNNNGFIFIGSTPNRNSICADLFRQNWNQHHPHEHLFHFEPGDFRKFFINHRVMMVEEKFFYLEGPYANLIKDMQGIQNFLLGNENSKSPPFWGNLMTLLFKKE